MSSVEVVVAVMRVGGLNVGRVVDTVVRVVAVVTVVTHDSACVLRAEVGGSCMCEVWRVR